jgi:phage FluMu protein Com
MLFPFVCTACGVYGSISVGPDAGILKCPRCAGVLSVERAGDESQTALEKPIDDIILSWVSQPRELPDDRPADDNICPACGLDGVMSCDSARGDTICPACMSVYWRKRPRGYGTIDCPSCGRTVEYSDIDRGRTIICPGCKYFLGCLVPPEKHAYRARGLRRDAK